jgi:ATP-dependent Zn protease
MIGREKRERIMTKEELARVAHHEAGHCLMGYILKYTEQPIKVSIIPRGEAALGFSQQKPTNKKLMVRQEILSRIAVLLGGRCAEKIMYQNVSTGASDDIEKVSSLLYNYSIRWGMNDTIGAINIDAMGNIGKAIGNDIMFRCKYIAEDIEQQTMDLLTKHKKHMIKLAKSLLRNETIVYKDFASLIICFLCLVNKSMVCCSISSAIYLHLNIMSFPMALPIFPIASIFIAPIVSFMPHRIL